MHRKTTLALATALAGAFCSWPGTTQASHLIGAEIDVYFAGGNQYEIRLLLWRDCASIPAGGTAVVEYTSPCGSGTITLPLDAAATVDVSPVCTAELPNSSCNGGPMPGIERVEYAATLTLAPCDEWIFQWSSCCFMAANNLGGVDIALVVHTTLNNLDLQCRNVPRFVLPGLPYRSSNSPFTVDLLGLIDGPGTPQYALVNLLTPGGALANYATGYTGLNPYPGMTVDPLTGVLSTSSTASFGAWVIVEELRHNIAGVQKASVERAFAMYTTYLNNSPAPATDGALTYISGSGTVTGARTIDVAPGGAICATMTYPDPDAIDSVFLTSDITSALSGASVTLTAGAPGTAEFCWLVPAAAGGAYPFMVTASDERCAVDQDQSYLYIVNVVPDTANPCGPVSFIGSVTASGDLVVVTDASFHVVRWELPGTEQASRMALLDLNGRVLAERTEAPRRNGVFALPASIADGVYLFACGDHRTRLVIIR